MKNVVICNLFHGRNRLHETFMIDTQCNQFQCNQCNQCNHCTNLLLLALSRIKGVGCAFMMHLLFDISYGIANIIYLSLVIFSVKTLSRSQFLRNKIYLDECAYIYLIYHASDKCITRRINASRVVAQDAHGAELEKKIALWYLLMRLFRLWSNFRYFANGDNISDSSLMSFYDYQPEMHGLKFWLHDFSFWLWYVFLARIEYIILSLTHLCQLISRVNAPHELSFS